MLFEEFLKDFLERDLRIKFEALLNYCENHEGELYDRFNKCPWFVDHGFEHAKGVLAVLDRILLPKFINDETYLNDKELFYLLCAVLLHDIGMCYGGEIEMKEYSDECIEVRKYHGRHSADIIKGMEELGLDVDEREIIAEIAKYHQSKAPLTDAQAEEFGRRKIEDGPIRKEIAGKDHERIRLGFLAALLQLADACDINYRRANKEVYDRQLKENKKEIKKIKKNFVNVAKAVVKGGIQKKIEDLEKETGLEKMLRLCTAIFVDIFLDITKSSAGRNIENKTEELKKETDPEYILSLSRAIKHDLSTFSGGYSSLLDLMGEFLARIVILNISKYHYSKHQSIKNVYIIRDYIVLEPYGEAGFENIEKAKAEIRKELKLVEEVFNDQKIIEGPPVLKDVIVFGDERWNREELKVEDDTRSVYERWREKRKKKWEEDFSKATFRLKQLSELDRLITNPNFIETPKSKGITGRNWKEIKETVYSDFYSFQELREGEILVIHGDIGIGKTTYMLFFVENILKTSEKGVIFLDSTRIESSLAEIKHETGKFVAVDALGRGGRLKEKSEQLVDFVKESNAKLILTLRTHEKDAFEDVVREKGYEIKTIEPKPPLDAVSFIVANYLLYFNVNADGLKPEEAFKLINSKDYVRYPKLKESLEMIAEKSNGSPFYIYHMISELSRKDLEFGLAAIKDLPTGVEELLLDTLRKNFVFKGEGSDGNKSFLKLLICLRNLTGYYAIDVYEALYEELKGTFDIWDQVEAFESFLIATERGSEFSLPYYWKEAINKALKRDTKDKWLADEFRKAEAELDPKIIENMLKREIEKGEINRRYFHFLACAPKQGLLDYAYEKFKEVEGVEGVGIVEAVYAGLVIFTGYFSRGFLYSLFGKYERGIEDFNKAIEMVPNYLIYYNRGNSYAQLKQYDRAIADYSRAIELEPNDGIAYLTRGHIYYLLGGYEKAMNDFNEAIKLNPHLPEAYNLRGGVYSRLKKYGRAIKEYSKAIELDPNLAGVYSNRGDAYLRLNQHLEAIEDFDKAIWLNLNSGGVYNSRGVVYFSLGLYEKAIRDFKTGAILFFTGGEKESAIQTFSSAFNMGGLKGVPQNDDVVYCGIASLLLTKRTDVMTKEEGIVDKLKKPFSKRSVMNKLKYMRIKNEVLKEIYELLLRKSKGEEVSEEIGRLEKGTRDRGLKLLLEMLKEY